MINGMTWAEWAAELFEFEPCHECCGDAGDHVPGVVLGNWFAWCKEG